VGFWDGPDALPDEGGALTVFEPTLGADRREALYADWKRAVERSRDWARE
jgi:glycerol kinase